MYSLWMNSTYLDMLNPTTIEKCGTCINIQNVFGSNNIISNSKL